MKKFTALGLFGLLFLLCISCTEAEKARDDLTVDGKNKIFPADKLTEAKKQTVKAAEGGTITIGEGDSVDASLDIPAGALAEDTEITVFKIDESALPKNAAGPAYEFKPDGLQFSKAVTLKIKYTADNTENLKLAQIFFNSDDYTALDNNKVDSENKMVAGETTHFSAYAPVIATEHTDDHSDNHGSDTSTTTDTSTATETDDHADDNTDGGQMDDHADDNTDDHSDDTGNTAGSNANCEKLWKAVCEKDATCTHGSSASFDCAAIAKDFCAIGLLRGSSLYTADSSKVDGCVSTLSGLTCEQLADDNGPPEGDCADLFIGTVANGDHCTDSIGSACKDGYCKTDHSENESSCGICTAFPKIGDACEDYSSCKFSNSEAGVCNENKCVALPVENQPCVNYRCAEDLYCDHTASTPTCKAKTIAQEGQECANDNTSCAAGLDCDYSANKCVKQVSLKPGDVCTEEDNDNCSPGYCKPNAAHSETGVCSGGARPGNGEPCPLDFFCAAGFTCDFYSGLCKPIGKVGDACISDFSGLDCESGYCDETTNKCSAALVCK